MLRVVCWNKGFWNDGIMAWAEWSVVIIVKELNGILEWRGKNGIGCWNNKRWAKLDVGNEDWLERWNDKDESWKRGWNEGWMDLWDWQLCDVRIQAALNSHDRKKKKEMARRCKRSAVKLGEERDEGKLGEGRHRRGKREDGGSGIQMKTRTTFGIIKWENYMER